MLIGVPKEMKRKEYRVGMTPDDVEELHRMNQQILVEYGAGEGSGFSDEEYRKAGAGLKSRENIWAKADLIVKVKEPISPEYDLMRPGQGLFTYLHLASNPELARELIQKKVVALAYETLEKKGSLPLLAPMSEIAGRIAPIAGSYFLQKHRGGTGVLPMGAVGTKPAKAVVLGAGTVGENAARFCLGLGMDTVVLNRGTEKLKKIDSMFQGKAKTLLLTVHNIREKLKEADLVIGAVLVPGGKTPILITRDMLGLMPKGAVIVDVSVDQGGCAETSRPTTHDDPVYVVDGIMHYAVANMPGAFPRTSTVALTNATLPYIKFIAERGIETAIKESSEIRTAVNVYKGKICHKTLAEAIGVKYEQVAECTA